MLVKWRRTTALVPTLSHTEGILLSTYNLASLSRYPSGAPPEVPRYTDEEYDMFLKDDSWSKFETDYLMSLASDYALNWYVMADRYSYGSSTIRSLEEIKDRINSIWKRLPPGFTHLHCPGYSAESERKRRLALEGQTKDHQQDPSAERPSLELVSSALRGLGSYFDTALPGVLEERRRIIAKFAGDLHALPAALLSNATLPTWPHSTASSSAGSSSGSVFSLSSSSGGARAARKRPSFKQAFRRMHQPSPLSPSDPASASMLAVLSKKEKSVIGPHARSFRLKPLRIGLTKHVEKVQGEFGLGARPTIPKPSICTKYDYVRALIMTLIDERKLTEKLEGQLKALARSARES